MAGERYYNEDFYTVICACGRKLESHERDFQCGGCGRLQQIVWPADPAELPKVEAP